MDKEQINKMNGRLESLTGLISSIRSRMSSLPEGNLRIRNNGGKIYYYADYEGYEENRKTPVYDRKLIRDLAQRSYYKKLIRSAQKESKAIEYYLRYLPDKTIEDIYGTLSQSRQDIVIPVRLPDKEYTDKWLSAPYERKPFNEGDPYYLTERGERVRSKSEQIIANRLYAKGIPYKYECPLIINGKTIYPDFTILKMSTRETVYYEHLGKMGDEDYANKAVFRINNYVINGITIGRKLFTTMESGRMPLDLRVLDKMIEENFR